MSDGILEFPPPDLEELFRTYAIRLFKVSRDERRLVMATNLGGQAYNVWGMDLDGPAYPYPLTHVDQVPGALQIDPQGRYLLAAFDHNGDELTHLYLVPPRGGALKTLRAEAGARFIGPILSRDGDRVYYTSDREERRYLAGYRLHLSSGEEERLFVGEEGATFVAAVAPDESSLAVQRTLANTYVPAYVVQGDVWIPLVPDPGQVHRVLDLDYLDAGTILFTTNYGASYAYLARFDIASRQFREVARLSRDMTGLAVHEKSHAAYVVMEAGVQDELWRCDLASGELIQEPLPVAVVEGLQVGESGTLYLLGRSEVEPFNVWRRRPGAGWERLSNNQVMGSSRKELSEAEVVTFPSFDGLKIEALWFPARRGRANGWTIVWPHGGPQAAERKMFRPFFQFAAARGYNLWAPNFRGSSGYGAEFMKMVERDWGEGPRRDVIASVDWLEEHGRVDPKKLVVVGGSYGGYMTLLLHGRHADRFQAFVDIFGPSDLITFASSVPEFWKPMMRAWLGDPEEDRARLVSDSPITYLEHMTRPMLVIQGANDPRVVKAESDQIVARLRERGRDVEYLVFDDEGHGFMRTANEIEAYRRVIEFLDRQRDK